MHRLWLHIYEGVIIVHNAYINISIVNANDGDVIRRQHPHQHECHLHTIIDSECNGTVLQVRASLCDSGDMAQSCISVPR